jgi:hypothetical protein
VSTLKKMTTFLNHQRIPVTDPVAQQVWGSAARKTVFYKGTLAVMDLTPACSTYTLPEVAAAEVTQVAVMYTAVSPCHLLLVFKRGFLSREFSSR